VRRLGSAAVLVLAACAHAGASGAGASPPAGPAALVLLYTGDGRGAIAPCG